MQTDLVEKNKYHIPCRTASSGLCPQAHTGIALPQNTGILRPVLRPHQAVAKQLFADKYHHTVDYIKFSVPCDIWPIYHVNFVQACQIQHTNCTLTTSKHHAITVAALALCHVF